LVISKHDPKAKLQRDYEIIVLVSIKWTI
jgi:hypothetical protein